MARKREPGDLDRIPPVPGVGTARASDQHDQRELARLTAAKIDEIESQMISGRPAAPRSAAAPRPAAPIVPAAASRVPFAPRQATQASHAGAVFMPSGASPGADRLPAPTWSGSAAIPLQALAAQGMVRPDERPPQAPLEPLEWPAAPARVESGAGTDALDAAGMAVQIGLSELLPLFEEAAVLYSNGQGAAAAAVLLQEIDGDALGAQVRQGWAMLFDIYQATGRKDEYESLALRFSSRFETSPPTWDPTLAPPVPDGRARTAALTMVAMPESLDAQAVRQMEQLQRHAQRNRSVTLDVSTVRSVDPIGADLLMRALVAFRKASRELALVGTESLHALLAGMLQAGRRDPSDACWLLQLELLRALDRQQEFDDLSIDYCVTYEVSPPSWEPATTSVRNRHADGTDEPRAADPGPLPFEATAEAFVLHGEIEGRAQQVLKGLRQFMHDRTHAVVDCRRLRRLDFVAAGEVLNEVVALRDAGKYLSFKDVNHGVAALLVVMGIPGLAEVRRRAA